MRLFLILTPFVLVACASGPQRELATIQPGMDKDQVLDKAGDPKRTFHTNGQDHWVYVYYENDHQFRQQVDFADGKVVRVGRPTDKARVPNSTDELESAETMEEFEQKARELQKKNHSSSENFQNVDGK